jgi:hypothetical protein
MEWRPARCDMEIKTKTRNYKVGIFFFYVVLIALTILLSCLYVFREKIPGECALGISAIVSFPFLWIMMQCSLYSERLEKVELGEVRNHMAVLGILVTVGVGYPLLVHVPDIFGTLVTVWMGYPLLVHVAAWMMKPAWGVLLFFVSIYAALAIVLRFLFKVLKLAAEVLEKKLPESLAVLAIIWLIAQITPIFLELSKDSEEVLEFIFRGIESSIVGFAVLNHFVTVTYTPLCRSRFAYISDITQFLNELRKKDPSLEERQREGRAMLWDKAPIDLEEWKAFNASTVPFRVNSSL